MKEEEQEEWDMPPQAERPSIAPEDQARFRRLLTELLFSASGALCLGLSAPLLREVGLSGVRTSSSSGFLEKILYDWGPLVMFLLAFVCLVWLITIPLRMASLRKD